MWPEGNKTQPQLRRTHQLLLNHGFYFPSFALLMFGFSINERNHLKWGSGEGGPLTPSSTTEIKGRPICVRYYLFKASGLLSCDAVVWKETNSQLGTTEERWRTWGLSRRKGSLKGQRASEAFVVCFDSWKSSHIWRANYSTPDLTLSRLPCL